MTKKRRKFKVAALSATVALMVGTLVASQVIPVAGNLIGGKEEASGEPPVVTEYTGDLDTGIRSKFDEKAVQKLPDGVKADEEISLIVQTADETILEAYDAQSSVSRYETVADFSSSAKGQEIGRKIDGLNAQAKTLIERSGAKFSYGAEYDMLLGGFEVVLKAGEYRKIASALEGTGFRVSVSEVYEQAEAQLVENDVNVHTTGIFNSEDSGYDGSGTVIAVLDTGLDYTHTAFDPEGFTSEKITMTQATIASKIKDLRAAQFTAGLSAAKVYISEKVPYGYDYADKDTDVYPLESEHGTHVSGVIVGNDDVIRGVAPNAQLISMKVFSDTNQGARWSWILAALEDCVTLEVDVINMSLGSSAGFTREDDETQAKVYDSLVEHGISLVAAASNDYNSTFGSVKNGNLGLTSSPDSATIGSPGSYTSALAVASISGVKTPYLTYNGQIMYFTESSDASSEPRNFVDDILPADVDTMEFEYVRIPGIGRSGDYEGIDVKGKIALVRRGDTTFEEKARIAQNKHAAGVIIYNNVSGDITMTVGSVTTPVCSISQDNGEILASQPSGKIVVSRKQIAGPFMSNFSSWGPTPDLRIKPEITAHGGDILSAVPGQDYDRLSGTSMASPNQAGVTALVRQYVAEKFPTASRQEALRLVNQIMMSTADIAKNVNALPYSVRKQGAGLANLTKATSTPAYISTYARNDAAIADGSVTSSADTRFTDEIIDKAKIEYGDDKTKSGVYELKFDLNNISTDSLSYDVDAIVMTEGISETKTHKGDTTVTEEGYILEGASVTVASVSGGTSNGNVVTVAAGGKATVIVRIELSESDKQYLDQSSGRIDANGNDIPVFSNGMYVEGYVTLKPTDGNKIDLSVPYLAFYGDWTESPIFDLDYFETDKDDRDDSIETLDKTLPDVFATIPVGGLYNDYISSLGSYYFIQDASAGTQISADRKYVSLTNQTGQTGGVNYIYGIYAGLLRGSKRIEMTITDSVTGEVVWSKTEYNQRKAASGTSLSYIDVDFHVEDYDLKNNTQYLFRAEAFLDYPGEQKNKKNVFEFPFVTDFTAPVLTDVQFYSEYDDYLKKDRLYARMYVYDNHYAMAYQVGRVYLSDDGAMLDDFTRLPVPIHSEFNSTSEVVFELTDFVNRLSSSYRPDTFTVQLYDYAMNGGVYEVRIPDSVRYLYFSEMEDEEGNPKEFGVTLSPNETYVLDPVLYPADAWKESLQYSVDRAGSEIVRVVNGKLLALKPGTATITATCAMDASVRATLTVKVLSETDPDYVHYDKPVVDTFRLTGYRTDYAFYFLSSADRDISVTGSETVFSPNATSYALTMFPSEKVTLNYELSAFFPADTVVRFRSGNANTVRVDDNGQITAVAEGISSVSVSVMTKNADGTYSNTLDDLSISITVKNPYERNGPYLVRYTGGGDAEGVVDIPEALGFTEISQYAFSGYSYIPKDLEAGDVIDEEDPSYTKPWYYGDNPDVKTVIIPEGVEVIGNYAFAGMTSLRKVVLPTTLKKIAAGAFYGCNNLDEIVGLEYVKFINQSAFSGPIATDASGRELGYYLAPGLSKVKDFKNEDGVTVSAFASIVAIGDMAFRGSGITVIHLPASAQSIGAYAFANTGLAEVKISASKIKLGSYAFANCAHLEEISLNASVIPDGVFEGSSGLTSVTLGKDVESIGVDAFAGTRVSSFTVNRNNPYFAAAEGASYLLSADNKTLVYVAPVVSGGKFELAEVETIGLNAFSGNRSVVSVNMPDVIRVQEHAFDGCVNLRTVAFGALREIGDYAFFQCPIAATPAFAETLGEIGAYAFSGTDITSVTVGSGVKIGEGAFRNCYALETAVIGDGAEIGAYAFASACRIGYVSSSEGSDYTPTSSAEQVVDEILSPLSSLTSLTIGSRVSIGPYAFIYAMNLPAVTFGDGVEIGEGAFYNANSLRTANLEHAASIGVGAFFSQPVYMYVATISNGMIVSAEPYRQSETRHWGAKLISVDLTDAESLGMSAFSGMRDLTSVTLGEKLTSVPQEAFLNTSVSQFDFSGIKEIGAGAFFGTPLLDADLSDVEQIGALAFADTQLGRVTFGEGALIDTQAFYGCTQLAAAANLNRVLKIGAGAFAGTALTGKLDLSSAVSIGDSAFMDAAITEVTLSKDLLKGTLPNGEQPVLGENPFEGCPLQPLTATVEDTFHGTVVDTHETDTFDLNEKVKIIGGAIYKAVPNGMVLVTYPAGSDATEYSVADGTVRISSGAFYGSRLGTVTLPRTLGSIGDKAFYGCDNLKFVIFKSLNAPILEEQYDEEWGNGALGYDEARGIYYISMPLSGMLGTITHNGTDYDVYGLGLTKYDMWNLSPVNYFYGATFRDYVGVTIPDLIMVRPSNGVNYDSYVFAQYFGTTVDGGVAAEQATIDAIEAIKALPDPVNLNVSHAAIVAEARRLYNLVTLAEQQALVAGSFDGVDYYARLVAAENTMSAINPSKPSDDPPVDPIGPADSQDNGLTIALGVLVGVFGATAIVAVVWLFLEKNKKKAETAEPEGEDSDGDGKNE